MGAEDFPLWGPGGFEKRRLRDVAVQSQTEETSQVPLSHRPHVPMGDTFHISVSLASKYLAAVAHCLYHTPSFCPNEGVNEVQLYTCLFFPLLCPMAEQCCGRVHKPAIWSGLGSSKKEALLMEGLAARSCMCPASRQGAPSFQEGVRPTPRAEP